MDILVSVGCLVVALVAIFACEFLLSRFEKAKHLATVPTPPAANPSPEMIAADRRAAGLVRFLAKNPLTFEVHADMDVWLVSGFMVLWFNAWLVDDFAAMRDLLYLAEGKLLRHDVPAASLNGKGGHA